MAKCGVVVCGGGRKDDNDDRGDDDNASNLTKLAAPFTIFLENLIWLMK